MSTPKSGKGAKHQSRKVNFVKLSLYKSSEIKICIVIGCMSLHELIKIIQTTNKIDDTAAGNCYKLLI